MKIDKELLKEDIKTATLPLLSAAALIVIGNMVYGRICASRILLGIPCPGCGITRAFLLVLRGQLVQATKMHPYWIVLTCVLIFSLAYRYILKEYQFWERKSKQLKMIAILLFVSSIVFYIYRMIVFFPNQQPMVYEYDNVLNNTFSFFSPFGQ